MITCFSGIMSLSAEDKKEGTDSENIKQEMITDIEEQLKRIEADIEFLKSKHAEIKGLPEKFENAKSLYKSLQSDPDSEDVNSTKKMLNLQMENLLIETKSKVALIKRLDLLYIMTGIFGIIIIGGIIAYSIYMFMKRR